MGIENTETPLGTEVHTCPWCKNKYYVEVEMDKKRAQVREHNQECMSYPMRYLHR